MTGVQTCALPIYSGQPNSSDKVLFGTDGYSYSDELGWPESTWIANRNARQALGIALTGMLQDGEVDRKRAGELARLVLRGNAEALYKF